MKMFTKKLLAVLSLSILSIAGMAQAVGDYRSVQDGNWSTLATWQRCNSIGPAVFATPTVGQGYPGQNAVPTTVTIQNTHDVILDATPTNNIGNLVIGSGATGTLTTSAANPTLTINAAMTINAGASFTFSSTGNLNVGGTTQVNGTFTDNTNGAGPEVDTFTGLVTISSTGTWATGTVTQENRIIFDGGVTNAGTFNAGGIQIGSNGTVTANALMTIGSGMDSDDNLTISGSNTVAVTGDESNIAVLGSTGAAAGNLTINGTLTLTGTTGAGVLDVTGNTIVNGVLTLNSTAQGNADFHGTFTNNGVFTDSNDSGIDTFFGAVSNTGVWTTTSVTNVANMIFQNGIANNGTFSAGSGTFNTRNQSLTGGNTITFGSLVVVTGFTVTNSNTSAVTMSSSGAAVLSGTGGTWTQDVNSTLNYAGSTLTVATFNASNTGNTVNYSRPGPATVRDPSASTYYHLTISGAGGVLTSSANHNINGNLTISGSAQFDVNAGTDDISVGGNWTVTSSNGNPFVEGAQTVTLDGSVAQTLTTALAGETFNNLVINNSFITSPQLTFSKNVTVTSVLTMTAGNTNLSGNTISLSSSAAGSLVHGLTSTSGWMYGGSFRRTFANSTAIAVANVRGLFPLGGSTDFRPFFVSVNSVANTAGTITVSHTFSSTSSIAAFTDGVTPVLVRSNSFWAVSTATISAGTFGIRYGGTGLGTVTNLAHLRSVLSGSTVATHVGASGSLTDPRVERSALTFTNLTNNFYVGSTNIASPLPIKLTYFKATVDNDIVNLNWATAQEINNDYFTIEKSSNPEQGFQEVSKIFSQGNSTFEQQYFSQDKFPNTGLSYYRLKQTDFDGTSTYSKLVSVNYEGYRMAMLNVYPNPLKNNEVVNVELKGLKAGSEVPLVIYNSLGQRIFEKTILANQSGMVQEEINFNNLFTSGVFVVKAGPTLQLTQRLVVE